MPSSKTDTAMRFPASEHQQRRMWTTQDKKAAARAHSELGNSMEQSKKSTTWSPEQMLEAHMNAAGNPEPDPATFGDGAKARAMGKSGHVDEADMFEAMNADTSRFE
ncbi:Uncharacterized protein PECH_003710 [Penicillium ucsense]|uniref:Uncharacterized protein n=1 Tax=Penicillium ucsense TaxID=2839758 RepID=A0A8J8WA49_9EURO|nr:Uncharacterized protein PECM_001792 [Penicillium ucsense]KAF7737527.1 Uncharacterized protein PECH_003710 [Penicillium ucsense]